MIYSILPEVTEFTFSIIEEQKAEKFCQDAIEQLWYPTEYELPTTFRNAIAGKKGRLGIWKGQLVYASKRRQRYVLQNLRIQVIQAYHDHNLAGHPGCRRTRLRILLSILVA